MVWNFFQIMCQICRLSFLKQCHVDSKEENCFKKHLNSQHLPLTFIHVNILMTQGSPLTSICVCVCVLSQVFSWCDLCGRHVSPRCKNNKFISRCGRWWWWGGGRGGIAKIQIHPPLTPTAAGPLIGCLRQHGETH